MMKRALLVAALVACGSPPPAKPAPRVTPSATAMPTASAAPSASVAIDPHFREHEPPLAAESAFEMPRLKVSHLANGMRLLAANTGGGMFAMRIVFEGPAAFPSERPPVSKLMIKALFGGTPTRDAHELRRVLEKRFASWGTYTLPDADMIEMTMPDDDVRPCIDVMADVVQHPNFDQLTVGFELLQLVEQGQTARESPSGVAREVLMRALYGDAHGYARSRDVLDGSPNVDRSEVQRVYREIVTPQNATIVLAGAVEPAIVEYVERAFGSWRAPATVSPTPIAAVSWKSGARLVVVDRPGAVQSEIAFGGLAPARSSPDAYTMIMIHELLGAHRTSRLTHALVERDASSYAGATHLETRRGESAFYWDSSVPLAKTGAVLSEIDKALDDLGKNAPPAAELDAWKARYVRQLPLEMETARANTALVSSIPIYKLGDDALDELVAGLRAVTPDAVKTLAAARLSPARTRAVVVGDWKKLEKDLRALGWGPIELRDDSGKVLRVVK